MKCLPLTLLIVTVFSFAACQKDVDPTDGYPVSSTFVNTESASYNGTEKFEYKK